MGKASKKRAKGNPEWKTQHGEPPPSPEDIVNHSSDYSLCPSASPVMATDCLDALTGGNYGISDHSSLPALAPPLVGNGNCSRANCSLLRRTAVGSAHSRRSSGGRCSLGKQGAHAPHNSLLVRFLRTGVLACAVS